MSRSVRRVAADWVHPVDANGHHIPLKLKSFQETTADWDEATAKWAEGFLKLRGEWIPKPDWADDCDTYEDYAGSRPTDPSLHMPYWPPEARTHWMMYMSNEDVPISPAMETPEALASWLVEHHAHVWGKETADYDAWMEIIMSGRNSHMMLDIRPGGVTIDVAHV